MDWRTHYFDPRLNRDAISRGYATKEGALRNACDLTAQKCIVRYVQGPRSSGSGRPDCGLVQSAQDNGSANRPQMMPSHGPVGKGPPEQLLEQHALQGDP